MDKYNIPDNNKSATMAREETLATNSQYTNDLKYGMEFLSKATPEELHTIVVLMADVKKKRDIAYGTNAFDILFDNWWKETCMYSGANLCYANENYKKMKSMGKSILPLIEEKERTVPEVMLRHVSWLKRGILS